MSVKIKLYLEDILESIKKIEDYTANYSYDGFIENSMAVDAVIRNLEIIGEAVKKIPSEVKRKYPNIEWKKIAGLRDILIHEYSSINVEIIWDVVNNKIPQLKISVQKVLHELK